MRILGGKYHNRKLETPKNFLTRPTTGRLREAVFNICQYCIQGARFLDLFAGSGAMGFEALSRGAASCVFVENSKESLRCIQKNMENLHTKESARIYFGNVFTILNRLQTNKDSFEIIYADPPFSKKLEDDLSTDLVENIEQNEILSKGGLLFLESPWKIPPPANLKSLQLKDVRKHGRAYLYQYVRN